MTFSQLQEALEANTLENPMKDIRDFVTNNIGHLESRVLYCEVLNQQIAELTNYNQSPLAQQIELITAVEQVLDIDPNHVDSIMSWLGLQVEFNFEQTDLDRYHQYLDLLKKDKSTYLKGHLYEIDLHLFNDNKLKAIDLYLHLIDYAKTLENRLERDFYVSLYLYYAVYYLSDEEIDQVGEALHLIRKHVTQLTYSDTYPLFYLLSIALDNEDLVLVDHLAFQLIPVIQNSHEPKSYDSNLEELLVFVLNNHPRTDAVIHAYLSLTSCLYGDKKWSLEIQRLLDETPKSNYLKAAHACLLVEQGDYATAYPLLKETLFKPVVEANFLPHYIVSHFCLYKEFLDIDLSSLTGNPIKLSSNTYILNTLENQLDKNQLADFINVKLTIDNKVLELMDNYLEKNEYPSSALMEKHVISQTYHNMACFILDQNIESLYPKAIEYSEKSQNYSFFYYQLSLKCNLYKALKDDKGFLEAIKEYLAYPIYDMSPDDYFRFKLQLATMLTRTGDIAEAIEVYKEVKTELMEHFRIHGTSDFNQDYLVHAFEADDTLREHISLEDREPVYTDFEYFQFFPKDTDVIYRLTMAYYRIGDIEKFEIYANHYFNAYAELDYAWTNEFYSVLELYIPAIYKTDPQDVIKWVEALVKYKADVPWLDQYVELYGRKSSGGGFFKNLFK